MRELTECIAAVTHAEVFSSPPPVFRLCTRWTYRPSAATTAVYICNKTSCIHCNGVCILLQYACVCVSVVPLYSDRNTSPLHCASLTDSLFSSWRRDYFFSLARKLIYISTFPSFSRTLRSVRALPAAAISTLLSSSVSTASSVSPAWNTYLFFVYSFWNSSTALFNLLYRYRSWSCFLFTFFLSSFSHIWLINHSVCSALFNETLLQRVFPSPRFKC